MKRQEIKATPMPNGSNERKFKLLTTIQEFRGNESKASRACCRM